MNPLRIPLETPKDALVRGSERKSTFLLDFTSPPPLSLASFPKSRNATNASSRSATHANQRQQSPFPKISLFSPKTSLCEENTKNNNNDITTRRLLEDVKKEKARVQGELDRLEAEDSCLSCLVTGVGTCIGLAGYFGYLAMEESHVRPVTLQVRQRLAFFGVAAVGWIGAGAYRLYLG